MRLIFVATTEAKATELCETILAQLKAGAISITMMGSKPTKVTEQ